MFGDDPVFSASRTGGDRSLVAVAAVEHGNVTTFAPEKAALAALGLEPATSRVAARVRTSSATMPAIDPGLETEEGLPPVIWTGPRGKNGDRVDLLAEALGRTSVRHLTQKHGQPEGSQTGCSERGSYA